MIALLQRIKSLLDSGLRLLLVVCFIVLIVDVLWGVGSRYVLGAQSSWTEELARALLIWVALLGGAVAYGERAHLAVDLIVEALDPGARRLIIIAAHLLCAAFAGYVMIWGGINLTLDRFAAGQTLPALQLSRGWVYLAIPVSGVLIAVYAIENIVQDIFLSDDKPVPEPGSQVADL